MLKAKRILALIAIVLCVMQILSLFVHIIRPRGQEPKLRFLQVLDVKRNEAIRRTLVWYIGGLLFLVVAVAAVRTQPWLQLSFGIAGVGAMLMGCAGGTIASQQVLWLRFCLSIFALAILVLISLHLGEKRLAQ